jgi:mannose-6-phosphate isomerase
MKVLFPREKLSVQVHPDDQYARSVGEQCGKTECWYILQAEQGAQIGLGFKPGTTRAEIELSIRENRMEHLLNWIDVHAGEMYYVDAGTVHAIAPGAVIVETQQNSDTTYRLYDYGRPRELHIERGLAAMKTATHAGLVAPRGETLIASPCFMIEKKKLHEARTAQPSGNIHCLFALDGAARIESRGAQAVTIARGETVVIPASITDYTVVPQWEIELLCASVPQGESAEPETELYGAVSAGAPTESS